MISIAPAEGRRYNAIMSTRVLLAAWVVAVAVPGCSTGSKADDATDVVDDTTDVVDDTTDDAPDVDAAGGTPDAAIVVPDAEPLPPDAGCVPQNLQLLANPNFDLDPIGTGWTEVAIDPMYPLITGDDGIAEHTAPYKAWMGGLEAAAGNVTDVLVQAVTLPADATTLSLTLQYEVRSGEDPGDPNAYDAAVVELTDGAGTVFATALAVDNTTPTVAWTPLTYTVDPAVVAARAGTTIQLRMRTSNDFSNATSFYFDTASLTALACP